MGKFSRDAYRLAQKANRGGYMAYDLGKPVFKDRDCKDDIGEGVLHLDRESYIIKGNTIFAKVENIECIIPSDYFTIEFFSNTGVPSKVYTSQYGNSLIIKEVYKDTTYLKAYDKNNKLIICEKCTNKDKAGIQFRQTLEVLVSWVEITSELYTKLVENILSITGENIEISSLDSIIDTDKVRKVTRLSNNVLIIDAIHQKLVVVKKMNILKRIWISTHHVFIGDDVTDELKGSYK